MELEINNMRLKLSDVKVLGIMSEPQGLDKRCCGINISLEYAKEDQSDDVEKHIESFICSCGNAHGYIIKGLNRIPIDLHGGNIDECYFGYINPTLLEE